MSRKRTIENRIHEYRLAHPSDRELDDLLSDCEAEIYKMRRDLQLLEQRGPKQQTLPAAEAKS